MTTSAHSPPEDRRFVRRWPWAQRTLAHINELRALADCAEEQLGNSTCRKLVVEAKARLDDAENAVRGSSWFWRGSAVDGALANMNAAHVLLLQSFPRREVRALLPELAAEVEGHLQPDDRRRMSALAVAGEAAAPPGANEEELRDGTARTPTVVQRRILAEAMRAAHRAQEDEVVRERSFCHLVYKWAAGLAAVAIVVGVLGFLFPRVLPLCFYPPLATAPPKTGVVCPTLGHRATALPQPFPTPDYVPPAQPWDYLVVELAGLVAAAVSGAASLHQLKGPATASDVPTALAVLKLPTGALTAVLGLLLMSGRFVPGLTALDTSVQIISWAVVFGAGQQLLTRFVDERGIAVMRAVPAAEPELPRPGEKKPGRT